MQKILVVEDEQDIADLISFNLKRNDFLPITANSGNEGLNKAIELIPDLIVLDVMLPGLNGFSVQKELKNNSKTKNIPVIMLTAKSQVEDRIKGLHLGVDDYMAKPFSPKELILRIRAILKRTNSPSENNVLHVGPFLLDKNILSFFINGEPIDLTGIELKLITFLLNRVNKTQDRQTLLREVWGYHDDVYSRTLDTHMKRLRKKIAPYSSMLETVRGVGYRIKHED